MEVIKQLKHFITGVSVFPITKTNAVYARLQWGDDWTRAWVKLSA